MRVQMIVPAFAASFMGQLPLSDVYHVMSPHEAVFNMCRVSCAFPVSRLHGKNTHHGRICCNAIGPACLMTVSCKSKPHHHCRQADCTSRFSRYKHSGLATVKSEAPM